METSRQWAGSRLQNAITGVDQLLTEPARWVDGRLTVSVPSDLSEQVRSAFVDAGWQTHLVPSVNGEYDALILETRPKVSK